MDPGNPWRQNRLIDKAVQKRVLRYCIDDLDPANFPIQSMEPQFLMAASLWSRQLESWMGTKIEFCRVECSSRTQDVRVLFTPVDAFELARTYPEPSAAHDFITIQYNTALKADFGTGTRTYNAVDFGVFSVKQNLEATLRFVSDTNPTTANDYAARFGFDPIELVLSTYPNLIHEMGHAFGLCDTNDEAGFKNCSVAYRSTDTAAEQPWSVMKAGGYYFHLTPDDIVGLRKLYDLAIKESNEKAKADDER